MMGCEISSLREKLEQLIACGASFQEIYTISTRLDKLIVAFYTRTVLKK